MSSSDIALSVRGLSKSYTIAHNAARHTTAGEAIMHRLKNPFHKPETETFWALQDVSFDIQKGDVVGIIGRNGAGKSTLLKILSRITEPTKGRIDLYGRVGSLLEVGTGFHQELTGRENIFLNGAILGMSKREIAQQFDAIVDFAGVESFLDTPVKRYSSGMYVRLAFAVAAHLRSEILIVDEVLAVGDAEFQKKCMGKMRDAARGGRTVLFVSHNMNAVSSLCTNAMLLSSGRLIAQDEVENVIQRYSRLAQANYYFDLSKHPSRKTAYNAILQSINLSDDADNPEFAFSPLDTIYFQINIRAEDVIRSPRVSIGVTNSRGERVFAIATFLSPCELPPLVGTPIIKGQFDLPPLVPGQYTMDIGIADGSSEFLDAVYAAATFDVEENNFLNTSHNRFNEMGLIMVRSEWGLASSMEMRDYANH